MSSLPKITDISEAGLTRMLESALSEDELAELLREVEAEEREEQRHGPQTDDELWEWIKADIGVEIPRVAVCPNHQAPFDFVADAYFDRGDALFLVASREAGKTLSVSIVQYARAKFLPGHEGLTFGAVEDQSRRAYLHIQAFIKGKEGTRWHEDVDDSIRRETRFKNGSKIEIVAGTPAAVNGPHSQTVHADEVDIMDPVTWSESRNIASSGRTIDGKEIPAKDLATSSRKSAFGLVQQILDEVEDAKASGLEAPWRVFSHCVWENAREVPDCQMAPKDEREARLVALGRDPCEMCSCHKVAKGEWTPGKPRLLSEVCKGRLFHSRGWMSHRDVVRKFRQNSALTWLAQQECGLPEPEGLYLDTWSRERHAIRGWVPDPIYGPIYMGVDWGGGQSASGAPHAVEWMQGPLKMPVVVQGYRGQQATVPQDSIIVFDEIYMARVGATKLADMVVARERAYKARFPSWRVVARFADPAGGTERSDWKEHDPPLRTHFYISRDFEPMVVNFQTLVSDNLFYVDVDRVQVLPDEIESWRSDKRGNEVKKFQHACLVAGTMVKTALGERSIETVCEGDEVLTRGGLRRVIAAGMVHRDPQPVVTAYFSDGSELTGTSDHPVWVEDCGFVDLCALRYADRIVSCQSSRASSIEAESSVDIQRPSNSMFDVTSAHRSNSVVANGRWRRFIGACGRTRAGRSLLATTFTTSTRTRATTTSRTSPASPVLSISAFTRLVASSLLYLTRPEPRCARPSESRSSGTLRKAARFVERLVYQPLNTFAIIPSISFASTVAPTSPPRKPMRSSAPTLVSQPLDAPQEQTISVVSAHGADGSSSSTDTQAPELAHVSVVRLSEVRMPELVYNLTVEGDHHEFFANGVLVHNCSGVRYAISNIKHVERRTRRASRAMPAQADARHSTASRGLPSAVASTSMDRAFEHEAWRQQLNYGSPWSRS